ncbi:MAG: NAD(P)-binding domain-containing protein [Caldilineaceae bacterium]
MTQSYGFIGLGNLGFHLASSLLRAGFPLTVHDLHKEVAAPLLAAGAVGGFRTRCGRTSGLRLHLPAPSSKPWPLCRVSRAFYMGCDRARPGST